MLNFSLRQSYYTDENASKFDNSYSYGFNQRAPNAFSPISLVARATPTAPLAIDYRLEYDPLATTTSPKLLGMSLNGMLRSSDVNVTGGWSRQAFTQTTPTGALVQANNIVQSTADFRIKQGQYGGAVQFYYDVTKSTLINQRYVASYNAQCCGVSFEYQSFNYPNTNQFLVPKDRRFNMSFTLAGVGSFANFFGAFGGGTYLSHR